MKYNRIVIFGSSGFVGQSVLGYLKNLANLIIEINSSTLDLTLSSSSDLIKNYIKDGDIIIFISAKAPCRDGKEFLDNLNMIKNFKQGILNLGIKPLKLLYVSSDAVYSDSKNLINEESEKFPDNLHGLMHLLRENELKESFKNILTIVRPTLIYGRSDPHNGYGPNKFYRNYKDQKKIQLFGKGEELRDHVHIDDVGKLIMKCIEDDFVGEVNAVSGEVISFREIAETFSKKSKNINVEFLKRNGPMPHNGYRAFAKSKAETSLNFKFTNPKVGIEKEFLN